MVIVYCAEKDKDKVDVEGNVTFKSPYGFSRVDHTATRAIIIGNHPKIAKAYRGIMPVEVIEKEEPTEDED